MKKTYLLIPLFFFNSLYAWQDQNFQLGTTINCDLFKNNIKDEENFNLQKCNIFKTTFEKYEDNVDHYNQKNKLGEKYEMKSANIFAEYKYKKYIYDNMDKTDKILVNKYKWEYISSKTVLDAIEISRPIIIDDYKIKVSAWFSEGNGTKVSNEKLLALHNDIKKRLLKAINIKYQFEINGNYTSLLEIEKELNRRGIHFQTIEIDSKF